jgi:two-component system, NarL family, nitrate/nitrite response regulator NarL
MPKADTPTISILIVDDHALLRDALAHDLAKEADFEVAGACGSVQSALERVEHSVVDVVLLDVDLGGEQGGEFLRQARKRGFTGKVIIVTVGVHPWEAERLLRDGASAIFLKQGTDQSLFHTIRQVAANKDSAPGIESVSPSPQPTGKPSRRPLSPRQHRVLRLLLEGKANKEIAAMMELNESQVKEALQGLFLKCGVRTRSQLVRVAIETYWDELTASQVPGASDLKH